MKADQKFIEMDIPVNGFQSDILAGTLYSAGCLGVHEMSSHCWRAYFNANWTPDAAKSLLLKLKGLNAQLHEKDIVISELPFQDWNAGWKKYFKPIEPMKGIWIRPPWEKLPAMADGIDIIINPQMGFGTGHHETTALMIKLMKVICFTGKSVLDVGTGSGILAILAGKLGAENIEAIDNDADAVDNAKYNIRLNRIDNIKVKCTSIDSLMASAFPIVLANINYEVLSSSVSKIVELLTKNSQFICSGILTEEAHRIESLYKDRGLTLLKQENMNEWTAMLWESG